MNCPRCGTQIEGRFCPDCGYDTSSKKECPVCKGEIKGRFCENCGYDSQNHSVKRSVEVWLKKVKAFVKHRQELFIGVAMVALLVTIITPIILYVTTIYREKVVSEVTVGMGKLQVEEILGEPTEDNGYKWTYFNDKDTRELAKLEIQMEDALLDEDEEELDKIIKKYDEKCAELEDKTFRYIEIYFDRDGEVESVFLDAERTYDDVKTSKTVYVANIDVDVTECFSRVENGKEEIVVFPPLPNELIYSVRYKCGNYYSAKISGSDVKLELNSNYVKLIWEDKNSGEKCYTIKPIK